MTTYTDTSLRVFVLALATLAFLVVGSPSAFAQSDDDDDFPTLDFAVKAMQGAQFFRTDFDGGDPTSDNGEFGFQRVRFNFEITADFHERIKGFVDLGHEPNDFGAEFAPVVDYVALDLLLSDQVTFRFGTPVTSLFNFRGYSDGAATQSNPLIGNSPIDFVTAETGVQLIGDFGNAGFDLTVTSPTFFETFAPGTGLSILGKLRLTPSEQFQVGAGVGLGTNGGTVDRGSLDAVNWITGDGENYNAAGLGQPNRYTHAYLLPGAEPIMLQLDTRFTNDFVEIDAWGGIGFEKYSFSRQVSGQPGSFFIPSNTLGNGPILEEDSQMWWLGGTAKINASEQFFLAARGSYAVNSSDWASDLDETGLFRIQVGIGVNFWERALWKLEFVSQDEGINSPGQVGTNWYGVLTELSLAF